MSPLRERHTITYRDPDEARNAARHYAWGRRDRVELRVDNNADERFATLYARAWRDYANGDTGPCDTIPHAYTHWLTHGGVFPHYRCQRCGNWAGRRMTPPAIPAITPRYKFKPLPPERAAEEFPTGQWQETAPPSRLCTRCLNLGYREEQFVDTATLDDRKPRPDAPATSDTPGVEAHAPDLQPPRSEKEDSGSDLDGVGVEEPFLPLIFMDSHG